MSLLMKRLGPSLKTKERGSIIKLRWKNQYLPEAAALAAPPVKVLEDSPTSVKNRVAAIEKAIEKTTAQKSIGLGRRKYTPCKDLNQKTYSQVIPSGSVLATA